MRNWEEFVAGLDPVILEKERYHISDAELKAFRQNEIKRLRYIERHSFLLAHEAGITYSQLHDWVQRGHVHPIAGTGIGTHNPKQWTEDERLVVIEMGRLVRAGLRPPIAVGIARKHVTEPSIDGKYLIAIGVSIVFED